SADEKFVNSTETSTPTNYRTISTFNQLSRKNIMSQPSYSLSVKVGDGNENSGNIIGSFNKVVNKSGEDAQIMLWLSPLEPRNRHQSVRDDRFDGVGDWLLETSEFLEGR